MLKNIQSKIIFIFFIIGIFIIGGFGWYFINSLNTINPIIPINDPYRQTDSFSKSLAPQKNISINLTHEVLEVFEILSSICIDSVINSKEKITDIGSTSTLIQNIINIIFGEIDQASKNYLKYRGISKRLVNQYHSFIICQIE